MVRNNPYRVKLPGTSEIHDHERGRPFIAEDGECINMPVKDDSYRLCLPMPKNNRLINQRASH